MNHSRSGSETITFRNLAETDLPLLHRWLNQPHMRAFYQPKALTLDEVRDKYLPRIRRLVPTFAHLAVFENQPIGKIQCYKNSDYPTFASEIGEHHGISVDLFVGEPEFLGRGLGKKMLAEYLRQVAFPLFPQETSCYICHEKENRAAIRGSLGAGFSYLRDVIEDGKTCALLKFDKGSFEK